MTNLYPDLRIGGLAEAFAKALDAPNLPRALCKTELTPLHFDNDSRGRGNSHYNTEMTMEAKALCARCPEMYPCRAIGMKHAPGNPREEITILGGLTVKDRRDVRKAVRALKKAERYYPLRLTDQEREDVSADVVLAFESKAYYIGDEVWDLGNGKIVPLACAEAVTWCLAGSTLWRTRRIVAIVLEAIGSEWPKSKHTKPVKRR